MKMLISGLVLLIPIVAATTDDSAVLHPDYLERISYIDSTQLTQTFSDELKALYKAGRITGMEELRSQLSNERCAVRLSAVETLSLSPVELYRNKKRAVVIVGSLCKCKKCSGWHKGTFATGFLVSSDGILVTNYHVIDQDVEGIFGAMTSDGDVYPVMEVLAANEAADIAILKLDAAGLPHLALGPEQAVGSRVWVISNPAQQFYTFTEGMVSGRTANHAKGDSSKRFSITADYGGGSSGAPVFDSCGNVLGMVCSTQVVTSKPNPHSYLHQSGYPQMVINHCIPSELIIRLFAAEPDMQPTGERQ